MALLFLDMLGVRSRWHVGGLTAVTQSFQALHKLVLGAMQDDSTRPVSITRESDSVAALFNSTLHAVHFAREMYLRAFTLDGERAAPHLWLRGCIVEADANSKLRTEVQEEPPFGNLSWTWYAPWLLEAIAVEKAGYRGMRLLIQESLVTARLKAQVRIGIPDGYLVPLKRLTNSPYPGRVAQGYQDVLWMMTESEVEWQRLNRRMADRLRRSAANSEEFAQAASTQVVFHECAAIIGSRGGLRTAPLAK